MLLFVMKMALHRTSQLIIVRRFIVTPPTYSRASILKFTLILS